MYRRGTPEELLLSRVLCDIETRCWNFQGFINKQGYGLAAIKRRGMNAHRAAYLLLVGPIAPGQQIHHICQNKRCVNPAHLKAVTPREHVALTPQSPAGQNVRKTHCPQGHSLTDDNLIQGPNTVGRRRRVCLTCARLRSQRQQAENPERRREIVADYRARNLELCRARDREYARQRYQRVRESPELLEKRRAAGREYMRRRRAAAKAAR